MSKEPKSLDFETRYEEAKLLPHYVWKANADVRKSTRCLTDLPVLYTTPVQSCG